MRSRYSIITALNRIVRSLEGKPVPSDAPPDGVPGVILSNDEAFSDIAELLEGSLPNETFFVPQNILDPYGGIYTWTGTVELTGITAAWTKVTGTYQNSMVYSTNHITCQPTQDRILINDIGVYEVSWSMTFYGSPDIEYFFEPYCFVGMPQASARVQPYASGSAVCVAGSGLVYASGTAVAVALYVKPSNTTWLIPASTQIHVKRLERKP